MKRNSNLVAKSKINTYLGNADFKPIKSIGNRVIYENKNTKRVYIYYNGKYHNVYISRYKNKLIGTVYHPPYHNKGR